MRIGATIVRLSMGLLFRFAPVEAMFKLMVQPELTGNVKLFNEGIVAPGYF